MAKFEKGHTPWLKGTKGLVKANSGSFKRGQPSPRKGKSSSTPVWNKGKTYENPKISLANKGKHYSPTTEFKKGEWKFKGTRNEYRALHKRITRAFGQPDKCESCNKSGLIGKQIHWANKSGCYEEERDDWLRLCVKCHYIQGGRGSISQGNKIPAEPGNYTSPNH